MANITVMTMHMMFSWDSLQPWARFLTVDSFGTIQVHEKEPREFDGKWVSEGLCEYIGNIEPIMTEKEEPVNGSG